MKLRPFPLRRTTALVLAGVLTFGSAAAATDPEAARFYENALARFEKQDLKGAIIQLKNALRIDRSMLPVHVLLGRALLADGQPAAAEVAFAEALRLGVSRAEVVAQLAESVIDQGKLPQVLNEPRFEPAGLPAPVQMRLLLLKAAAAGDTGDLRQALRLIEQARALDPTSPDAWLAEVPLHLRARDFERALAVVDRVMALTPGSAPALYQRAQVQHLSGNLAGALQTYGEALANDPAHVEARVARAGLRVDLNQLDGARADVAELRRLAPSDPRGAYLAALLAEKAGDTASARTALKEVTALIDPVPIDYIKYRPQVLMLNGLAHYGLGERENAKPYLESYQKLDPGGGVSKLLAQILLAEGNVQAAVDSLEKYLRAQPGDSQAQALLASAHMALGRPARATAVAQEALKHNDAPELRTALGLSMLRAGQAADALAELESAYRRDPSQLRAAATLVGLYLQRGAPDKALALAQTLARREPENAAFATLLGQAQLGSGQGPAARKSFETAQKLDPALQAPQIQLARLDAAGGAFEAAEMRLNGLLARDERNTELLVEQAALAERRGKPDDARRWLEKAVDHSALREYRPALALVDLHLRHGRPAQAVEVAKSAASRMPSLLEPQLALARAQLAAGDREGARGALNTATRLANYDAPLQLEIGLLQMLAGNLTGAAYSFEKGLSGRPDFLPAQAAMVDVELRQGRLDQAATRARAIVQAHPKRAIGHSLLGDLAWSRGDVPAATEAYRRAHQAEPSTETVVRLHSALSRHSGPKAAAALLEGWLKEHPKDRIARHALAGLYAGSGRPAAARPLYEALLQEAPADPGLLNNLANVLLQIRPADALPVAERAYAAAGTDPAVIDTYGWVLFRNGQAERALQLLRDARLRRPSEPTIRYHLAAVLAHTGRPAEARAELQAALAGAPGFEGYEDAQALLKSLP